MTNARSQFHKCGLPMEQLRQVDTNWELKALSGSTETVYKKFKEHYIKELQLLHVDRCNKGKGVKDKAYTTEITRLERGLTAVKEELEGLEDRQYKTAVALRSVAKSNSSGSSTAGTTVSDLTTLHGARQSSYVTTDQLDALKQQWQAEVLQIAPTATPTAKPNSSTNGWQTRRNRGEKTWRQYKHYCWSCVVNLNHDSAGCFATKQLSGHQPDATFENKKGGSEKNEHRWMWWNSPDGNVVQERSRG